MSDHAKLSVLGVLVDAVDYKVAVERIVSAAIAKDAFAATALAVHGVMSGVDDPTQRHRLNSLDLVCPDGQPVRWALNALYGVGLDDRVYGPELMLRLCRRAASESLPIFLYGSTQEVLDQLTLSLISLFPNLRIAGHRASRFRLLNAVERAAIVEEVKQSGARLLFAGLGCPRQEVFVYDLRRSLRLPMVAVGAAFSFHAGLLPQAPRWMQKAGLEWLFRLTTEPRRLWRRYLTLNPRFILLMAAQALRLRSFDSIGKAPQNDLLPG